MDERILRNKRFCIGKIINMSHFNKEYYVMDVDGANNHPLLVWGDTDSVPFDEELL